MAKGPPPVLTARHWLQAREVLGWSQAHLATTAGVGIVTVIRLEHGGRRPGHRGMPAAKAARVRGALESAGVEFIEGGARLGEEPAVEEAILPRGPGAAR